jgi:hypothetical protein
LHFGGANILSNPPSREDYCNRGASSRQRVKALKSLTFFEPRKTRRRGGAEKIAADNARQWRKFFRISSIATLPDWQAMAPELAPAAE